MNENKYADLLFGQYDKELDRAAKRIRNHIISQFREVGWKPEQYKVLQPLIREELDALIYHLLNSLDNVGSVLPEGVYGFEIRANDLDENGNFSSLPIREGAFPEYGEMWYLFIKSKLVDNPRI